MNVQWVSSILVSLNLVLESGCAPPSPNSIIPELKPALIRHEWSNNAIMQMQLCSNSHSCDPVKKRTEKEQEVIISLELDNIVLQL